MSVKERSLVILSQWVRELQSKWEYGVDGSRARYIELKMPCTNLHDSVSIYLKLKHNRQSERMRVCMRMEMVARQNDSLYSASFFFFFSSHAYTCFTQPISKYTPFPKTAMTNRKKVDDNDDDDDEVKGYAANPIHLTHSFPFSFAFALCLSIIHMR